MSEALKGQTALVTVLPAALAGALLSDLPIWAPTLLPIMQVAKRLQPRLWKRFAQRRIGHRG